MAFTKAQTDAMNARGRSLLVSAAAGSGKTFTLTRRIIDSIIENEEKTISRMLIVTFTRSAAAELKKKISDALSEAIAAHPDNKHLQEELLKLGSAHISTIDSFFSAPVKANFEKLGLPASMRLADDAELIPLRESLFKETLGEFFNTRSGIESGRLSEVGHRSTYTDLLSLMSGIRDSSGIIPTLLECYNKTQSVPDGIDSLRAGADRIRTSADLDFFSTLEGEIIKKKAVEVALSTAKAVSALRDEIIRECDAAGDGSASRPPHVEAIINKVIPTLDGDETLCLSLSEKLKVDYTAGYNAVQALKFKNYPTLKDMASPLSESIKEKRKAMLAEVKALKKNYFSYTAEAIKEQFLSTADSCLLLFELLSEFDRRYNAEKRRRGICEFADMPKFVLKLLLDSDGNVTPLAKSMAAQYDEVYIDEYQDVNAIQDKIFEIIGGERRFMVGDIKQSIYCFRDAEPSIFASYREKFPEYDRERPDEVPESGGSSIFMSENFRCDRSVVDFVNEICDRIFSAFRESIGYDKKNDMLRFGKIGPSFDPPKRVKLTLVEPADVVIDDEDTDSDEPDNLESAYEVDENANKLYDEAVITANEIARLIRDKNELNADGSKLRAGDIAILVRGHKQILPLSEALNAIGIKYVTNAKNELLSGDEMKLLVDILTVIDNPREDIPLCRVLTASLPSYFPILTLDEVIMIKERGKSHSLYDALEEFAREDGDELESLCYRFIFTIKKLRRLSERVSSEKLLRATAACPHFATLCESDAFIYLYNVAGKYSKNAWNGLYSFITYFKSLMDKGDSNSDPIKAGADEVTIITMHQSKGLEYKVCFLFGLGKEFNFKSLNKPIVFNRELGISLKLPEKHPEHSDVFERARIRRESNALLVAATLLAKDKMLEEEARIFYVAMTRAKERLYLSATVSKSLDELISKLSAGVTESDFRGAKSYFRWLLLSISDIGLDSELFEIIRHKRGEIPPLADKITAQEIETNAYGITEADKSFAKDMLSPHGESELEKKLSMIPAKVAASKVSKTMLDDSVFTPTPTGDLFTEGEDKDRGENAPDTMSQIEKRIELMKSHSDSFDSLLEINKKPTAAERGSAAHRILQFCDYERAAKSGLDAEIERLVNEKFITRRDSEIVRRRELSGFFEGEFFSLIRSAKMVRREFKFGLFRSAADFTENEEMKKAAADKRILVQGSIDLILETDEGIILCDYKTDKIGATDLDKSQMLERHKAQLEEYRFAIKEIFGQEPARVCIYSIPLGEIIDVE